jgi:Tfp pilus assembly protein PilF
MFKHRTLLAVVAGLSLSCASTPEPTPTVSDVPASAAPAPVTAPEPTASTPQSPPPAEPPPPVASPPPPKSGDRTGDGIDDENWLPRKDTAAYASFVDAAATVRVDPRAAVNKFVAVASASPGFYAAWFNAGAAAEAAGDRVAAEQHYRQALKVRADYGPALANLAVLLTATGRDADAQRLVDDALTKHGDAAGPHLAAAIRSLGGRDLVTAEREAREAVQKDERNVPAMLVMAQVFRAQGRLDTARFAVDNALALEPGNALLHVERGLILQAQGEAQEALFAFERAARLHPTLADALEPYGKLLLERGFAANALQVLRTLSQLRPKSGSAQLLLANALRATKDYGGAEAGYRRALELDQYIDEAHFNLGLLYIDNAVGGADELVRLQRGVAELRTYESKARPDATTKARLAEYLDSTDKRIARETKRRERDQKRKAEDAKKAEAPAPAPAAAAPAAPPAAPAPAAPPAPVPEGSADDK